MTGEEQISQTGPIRVQRPSEAFSAYCNAEFERRRNSDEPLMRQLIMKRCS